MRHSIRCLCFAVLVFAVLAPGVVASECTRLSGPPSYPNPVLARFDSGPVFRAEMGSSGGRWILGAHLGANGSWRLERLSVTGPDVVESDVVAVFSDRRRGDWPRDVFTGDVDGDGRFDLLVQWKLDGGKYTIDVLLNEADALRLHADALPLATNRILQAALGDFDGDGIDELATKESASYSDIKLYSYEGAEGFRYLTRRFVINPFSLVAMDVDSDGIEDLLHLESSAVVTHFGDPDSPLFVVGWQNLPFHPTMLAVRVNGRNGTAEVAVTERTDPWPDPLPVKVHALLHLGRGYWQPLWSQNLPDGLHASGEAWDVDGDGHHDLVLANGDYWDGDGGFQIMTYRHGAPYVAAGRTTDPVRLLDVRQVDGDDLSDAIVTAGGVVSRYVATEPLMFEDSGLRWAGAQSAQYYHGRAGGDLDGDGLEDEVALLRDKTSTYAGFWWRSRGDGTYDEVVLDGPGGYPGPLHALDIDGDTHVDLVTNWYVAPLGQRVLFVAWGSETGPTEWRPALQGYDLTERVFADLDNDGDQDLLSWELREGGWRDGSDIRTFINQGRSFRLAWSDYLPPLHNVLRGVHLAVADLDQDGFQDVIHYTHDPEGTDERRLAWRRNEGDGQLGPGQFMLDRNVGGFSPFVPTDVDRDGDPDLIFLEQCYGREGEPVRVLGNDDGTFRSYWSGPADDCPRIAVADVDGDGLLDLYEATGEPGFRIWTANGIGGFTPSNRHGYFVGAATRHGYPVRALGGLAADFVRVVRDETWGLVTVPQLSPVLESDVAAPEVELWLIPEIDTCGQVETFSGSWRVTALASDECTATEITRVFAQIPGIDPAVTTHYRPGPQLEFRMYESADGGGQEVVLEGPSEDVARDLFAAMLDNGGFHLEPNAFLDVQVYGDWGRPPHEFGDDMVNLNGARLTHLWRLDAEGLAGVIVRKPGGDVVFDVEVVDGAGHRAQATGTFRDERDRYCADHPGAETICQ